MTNLLTSIKDCIWPTLDGPPPNPPNHIELEREVGIDVLELTHGELKTVLEEENERRRTVDNKLIAILSLSSFAESIILGIIALVMTKGLGDSPLIIGSTIIISGLYVGSQFLRAFLAVAEGMKPRTFSHSKPVETALNGVSEGKPYNGVLFDIMEDQYNVYLYNSWATNLKLDQVSIAIRSIKNAIVAILVSLAVLFSLYFLITCGFYAPVCEWLARSFKIGVYILVYYILAVCC